MRINWLWNIFVWVFIMLTIATLMYTDNIIEKNAREQARLIAQWIWECINLQVKWWETREDLSKISYECWALHRSWWITWDFFVVNLATKQFIYDWSPDCSKDWYNRHLTDAEECSLHSDSKECSSAIKVLKEWFNSNSQTMLSWKFDDAIEWLEWVVIPGERQWYEWPIWFGWIKNDKNTQLLVVMGTQSDEVFAQWSLYRTILMITLACWVFLTTILYLSIHYDRENH